MKNPRPYRARECQKSYYAVGDKISYSGVEYTVTHIEEIKDYIRVVAHC